MGCVRTRTEAGLLAALFLAAPAAAQEAPWKAALDRHMAALEAEGDLHPACLVRTLEGKILYAWRPGEPRVLASNLKLLTTAAVLWQLPPDWRWTTRVWLEGDRLWIAGDGDPSLRRLPDHDAAGAFLDALAAALGEAGCDRVGGIVLDDRAFGREFRPPAWPPEQWDRDYCAPVAALSVEANSLLVRMERGGAWSAFPAWHPPLRARVRDTGGGRPVAIRWEEPDAVLAFTGDPGRGGSVRLAVRDPLAAYGRWLRAGLRERGIAAGAARPVRPEEERGPSAREILAWPSHWRLAEAVVVANKDSENFTAEVLLRTLALGAGRPGTREEGLRRELEILEEQGLDPAAWAPADGSGMGRKADGSLNRASPQAVCDLLEAAARSPFARLYFDSLPAAGVAGQGRLEDRFQDPVFQPARVRAKTGFITGASSLSGYALAPDDTILVFSTVINYRRDGTPRTNNRRFRDLQEEVLRRILQDWTRP